MSAPYGPQGFAYWPPPRPKKLQAPSWNQNRMRRLIYFWINLFQYYIWDCPFFVLPCFQIFLNFFFNIITTQILQVFEFLLFTYIAKVTHFIDYKSHIYKCITILIILVIDWINFNKLFVHNRKLIWISRFLRHCFVMNWFSIYILLNYCTA